jgi:4-hydroxy-3-methylbut-2-en-1-yl diphosphate reductase
MDEAKLVMDYIERLPSALDREAFLEHFAAKTSPGFDPDLHLDRSGAPTRPRCWPASRSGSPPRWAARWSAASEAEPGFDLANHFRSFDTICSATQERQDAVDGDGGGRGPPDVMVVIGGYNSSNTNHLAVICARYTTTYHIADASCIDPAAGPSASSRTVPRSTRPRWRRRTGSPPVPSRGDHRGCLHPEQQDRRGVELLLRHPRDRDRSGRHSPS